MAPRQPPAQTNVLRARASFRPAMAGGALRAILFADLVGYSSLMSRDEIGTLDFIVACSNLIEELSASHNGWLVQSAGDGYLVVFETTLDAVEFSVALHRLVSKRQTGRADPARFRVGIHVGEVHHVNGTIYGHAVNIAARLQAEALPGTSVLSQRAYEAVRDRCQHPMESIGRPPLKNIAERIALYRIPGEGHATPLPAAGTAVVQLIGGLRLQAGDSEVVFPGSGKVSAMFAYLALSDGMRQRHEKIVSLLWPENAGQATRSFADCRRRLAQLLSGDLAVLLVQSDGHLGLSELHFDSDLHLIERDVRRGRVPPALLDRPDWPEAILEGFDSVSPVFSGWLKVVRATWRSRILAELSELLSRSAPGEDQCRDAARAILAIDPGNEAASVALMTHHRIRNNRVAAIEEFARLESHLRTRHDLSPGEAAQAALRSVRDDGTAAARPSPATPLPPSRPARLVQIAIAPFPGAPGTSAHLIDGFRSELLANLARFREWSVIDDDGERRGAAVATDARAGHYVVQGEHLATVDGPRLRLRLQDIQQRRLVWSDDLSISLQDWASLQRNIVGRIAAHLETYISADRLHNAIGGGGQDTLSHDTWLRAEQIFSRWTPEAADEAETLLNRLIERDDTFAPAFASLAGFRNVQHVVRPGRPRDAVEARQAQALAQRAVELDPLDARNHLALAWTAALADAFDRAAIHLDLAVSLNPNSAATLVSCAMAFAFIGQPDRAQALVAHVLRISPMLRDYQWCYIASVHFLSGRYQDALNAAHLSGDRIVDNPGWTAAALVRLGRTEEARQDFARLIDAVRPVWAGDGPPTAEAVCDWFTSAYPLRHPEDREALRTALEAAMRGQ